MIHQCGVRSINYCVISSKEGEAYQHVAFKRRFDKECTLVKEILAMERPAKLTTLDDDIDEAKNVFSKGQPAARKVCLCQNASKNNKNDNHNNNNNSNDEDEHDNNNNNKKLYLVIIQNLSAGKCSLKD